MANANIFQQYLQPVKTVAERMDEMDARDTRRTQNALLNLGYQRQLAADQRQQGEQNALQRIASGWSAQTTTQDRINALRNSGLPGLMTQADALEKSDLERQKAKADAGKNDAETLTKHLEALGFLSKGVMANPTPQNAALALDAYERLTGRQSPEDRQVVAQLQTPEQVRAWAAGHALKADQLLPQIQTRNTGGSTDTLAIDPLTGKPTVTGSVRNTQSPDSAASVAATIRGQNMTDARAREQLAQGKWQYDAERGGLVNLQTGEFKPATQGGQPLGAKDKPLTDSQSKAYAFGTRMAASNQIIEQLEQQGVTKNIPGMNTGFGIGRTVTALAGPQQQQLEQAKRDWINANLRRESGAVIGQSEFDSADRQYFAQPGDSQEVIRQKASNRKLAEQGVLAEVPASRLGGQPVSVSAPAAAPKVVNFSDLK